MSRSSALLVFLLRLSHQAIATVSFGGDLGHGRTLVPWPHNDNDNHEGDWHDGGDRDDDDDDDREDDDREQDAMELPPGCTKDRARDLGCEHIKCICERSADGFLQELATSILQTCKTLTDFGAELDRLPSACDNLDIKIPDFVIEHASSILNSFTSSAVSSKPTFEQSSTRMTPIAEEPKTSPTTADEGPGKTTKTTVEETSPETSQPAASATIPETSSDTGSTTSAVTAPAGGDPSMSPTEASPSTNQAPSMPTSGTSESTGRAAMPTTKTSEPTGSRQQPSTTDTTVPGTGSVASTTVSAATGAEPPEGPVVMNGGSPFDSPVSGSGAEQPGRSLASLVLGLAAVAALGW
ncbi:hypothetical protein DL766_004221 [Monosporascus sp. MC13-8B]|nr:hypothetical protein DL763_010405 [Monosporascus cannonballus]RYP31842.1 hypothetical protein DL766_004221 [Monosporascus sp. MC13-8B]